MKNNKKQENSGYKTKRYLINPELMPPNLAGKSEKLDEKARNAVLDTFNTYDKMRSIVQGGVEYRLEDHWDELYRVYMAIRNDDDHNYQGMAKVFMPVARRAVNVIESEGSNALFGREDYFSIDPEGAYDNNKDMSNRAFQIQLYYSNREKYVSEYELAFKQLLIYGCTAVESMFHVDTYTGIERVREEEQQLDPETGEVIIGSVSKKPKMKDKIKTYKVDKEINRPRVEARDIYRMYVNILCNDPSKDDVIYREEISANRLLQLVEEGVYRADVVNEMLKNRPMHINNSGIESRTGLGDGKTAVGDTKEGHHEYSNYEVLRYQGLFCIEDEEGIPKIKKQFWIDIGEREHVLRLQESPVIGEYKTFRFGNADSMISEFCTDGVIAPIKHINYEINDKENQSLDGLSFVLNAPFEIVKGSGLSDSDIEQAYFVPHKALWVKESNSVRKVTASFDLNHINSEIQRLNQTADTVAGSTSIAQGAPTGTQVDRSGKAIGLLQAQSKAQFSKLIRKFERDVIQASLQDVFNLIMQFSDDEIEIELFDEKSNEKTPFKQKVHELVGRFNIRVSAGSQYLKEKEMRESIMEFMSIAGTNDVFMRVIDPVVILTDIAKSSAKNMEKYINPENMYNQMREEIEQLNKMLEQQTNEVKAYAGEVKRLTGELQQTDRSNMANPPMGGGKQ